MDHEADTGVLPAVFPADAPAGLNAVPRRAMSCLMPLFTLEIFIDEKMLPLIEALRGKHELDDFLRGATQLGLTELIADAARINSDRQVSNLREVAHQLQEPVVWQQLELLLSTTPRPEGKSAPAEADERK